MEGSALHWLPNSSSAVFVSLPRRATRPRWRVSRPLGIETLALDVTSDSSIEQAVAVVQEKLNNNSNGNDKPSTDQEPRKRLDLLINNAGVNYVLPFSDTKISVLRRVFDTNVIGSLAVTQAFIPLMMHRGASTSETRKDGRGKSIVVMLGSVNEVFSPPYQAAYNASKAAVHAAARTLRVELAPPGHPLRDVDNGERAHQVVRECPVEGPRREFLQPRRAPDRGAGVSEKRAVGGRGRVRETSRRRLAEAEAETRHMARRPGQDRVLVGVVGMGGHVGKSPPLCGLLPERRTRREE